MSQETASVLGNSYRIYSLKYIPYTHSIPMWTWIFACYSLIASAKRRWESIPTEILPLVSGCRSCRPILAIFANGRTC